MYIKRMNNMIIGNGLFQEFIIIKFDIENKNEKRNINLRINENTNFWSIMISAKH